MRLTLTVPGRLDVDEEVPDGTVVAVVGPNGAGKSTLVHALAGLQPADGTVLVGGSDLHRAPPGARRSGLVFQDRRLFPHLSALENVAFGPRARGAQRGAARATAREWLTRLGVADLAHRRPGELSGGQAQRVAIARALAGDPDLLLLDEPFTGLDVGVAAALRIELAHHLTAFRGTTFLVTHDALDALTLADHVLVMEAGRVVQSGEPDAVAARPQSEHAARLVGLNVLRQDDHWQAFAPSAVTVSLEEPHGSARHRWHGTVTSAVPHGDALRLRVDAEGRHLLADVTPAATRELGLAPGRAVWVAVKATAVTSYPAAETSR